MKQFLPFALLAWLAAISPSAATHYRIYLLGGQSNGNGRADAAQLTPPFSLEQTDVRLYYLNDQDSNSVLPESQWINLAPGSGHGTGAPVYPVEFGPEVSFGRAMADAKPTENIAIIKYTYGGSNLSSHWAAGGARYTTFVSTVQAGLAALTTAGHTYVLRGMLWQQGEADTSGSAADNYQANLTNLIARVRTDLNGGVAFPFVIGSLSDSQYGGAITTPGQGAYKVRQAQEAVAAADPTVGIAISDGFSVRSDVIHFDHNGQVALGQGHATQMLALEGPGDTNLQLSSTTPVDGASSVPVETNLVATFSEPIQLVNDGTVTLRDLGPGDDTVITLPDARVSASGNDLVINPATDLVAGNPYAVQISSNAVEDLADNVFAGIVDDTTWNFTTAAADPPPQVSTYSPADGSSAVALNSNLVITFNEPVAKGLSGDIVIKETGGAVFETIPVTDARVGFSGSVVTINPSGTFALNQGYHVQIAAGAIEDLTGNAWAGIADTDSTTWNFTTVAANVSAGTTGVFDENTDATNALDIEIPSATLGVFKAAVLAAFNKNLGGVIDWETGVTTVASATTDPKNYVDTSVGATFGPGGNKVLLLTFDRKMALYTNDINSQVQVLSRQGTRHNALVPDGGNATIGLAYGVAFSGADVVELGMAVASRNTYGALGVDFRATATHSGGGSQVVDFTVGNTPGASDTLLHFIAPPNQSITSVSVAYLDDNGQNLANGQRRPILDDLGFIVAPPPSGNTFADWIAGKPGVNGQTAVNQDPDGDGIENGVENYFGTEPGTFSQGLQAVSMSGNTFTFAHPLNDTPAGDLIATYRWSTDLLNFYKDGTQSGEGTTTVTFSDPTPAGDVVSVTATITGSVIPGKLFVDVEVTQP